MNAISEQKSRQEPELKPCPCCGNRFPFTYITAFVAVLRCGCGLEMKGGAVSVLYKRDDLPEALKPFAYEATALVIRREDGTEAAYPDHGYVGVNVMAAFDHAGVLDKWNRRAAAPDMLEALRDSAEILFHLGTAGKTPSQDEAIDGVRERVLAAIAKSEGH